MHVGWMGEFMPPHAGGCQRTTCRSLLSTSILWVLRIKLRLLALGTATFTYRTISLVHSWFCLCPSCSILNCLVSVVLFPVLKSDNLCFTSLLMHPCYLLPKLIFSQPNLFSILDCFFNLFETTAMGIAMICFHA